MLPPIYQNLFIHIKGLYAFWMSMAMVGIAERVPGPSWLQRIHDAMHHSFLPDRMPDVHGHPAFPDYLLRDARSNRHWRKDVLRRYRCDVVRPILREYDAQVHCLAASPPAGALPVPVSFLH